MHFDGSRHRHPWKILPDATLATEVSRGTSLVYPPWTRTTVFPKSVLMPTMIWFGWKSTNTCRNKETRSSPVGYYNLIHFGQPKVSRLLLQRMNNMHEWANVKDGRIYRCWPQNWCTQHSIVEFDSSFRLCGWNPRWNDSVSYHCTTTTFTNLPTFMLGLFQRYDTHRTDWFRREAGEVGPRCQFYPIDFLG